jgi:hypothetical protein
MHCMQNNHTAEWENTQAPNLELVAITRRAAAVLLPTPAQAQRASHPDRTVLNAFSTPMQTHVGQFYTGETQVPRE